MSRPTPFSSGLEFATLVTSTALLRRSWEVIDGLYGSVDLSSFSVEFKVHKESDLTIVAFVANERLLVADLVPSSDPSISHFKFLSNESFSVNKSAIGLLSSLAQPHDDKLDSLKSQINSSTPLIVTGHALGGSIASLFALWLLDTLGSSKKRPLCITFGSPFIGDQHLQQTISSSDTWKSCFLHLAHYRDPLPRSFIPHSSYKPFGTFLVCFEKGASCFESPDSILEVLNIMGSNIGNLCQGFQHDEYREIVEVLNRKAICKEFTTRVDNMIYANPLKASIVVQLQALGLVQMQQHNTDINILIRNMERECIRRKKFNPSEKLNTMKINMAYLEWYKKVSKSRRIGYYDAFKNEGSTADHDVVMYKKMLTGYWKDMVAEAEKKPQREGAAFRTRWLFAGTNYRRMVEPLDIAEHYKKGDKDYETPGKRSNHYIQLEKWLEEDRALSGSLNSPKRGNVESILTFDSCFWAHVEEAVLLCRTLRNGGNDELTRTKLRDFEDYVFGLLRNYEVSPEIFLEKSSYMSWWREYRGIVGVSYDSALANFMRNSSNYKQYAEGAYDFY